MAERTVQENYKQYEQPNTDENAESLRKVQVNFENEQNKRQEAKMMTYFNQEFIDRKIDFKPK